MTTTPDRLDEAIDQVAKRLTQVAGDDALATRILASLPDSPSPLRWWMPRLAITAVLAVAVSFVVLRPFDGRSTGVLPTESAGAPFVEFRAAVDQTAVEPELIVRRTTVERSQNVRRTTVAAAVPDHEFSLLAIDSPDALSVSAVAPKSLPVEEALSLAPLRIADLPLTAETISPR